MRTRPSRSRYPSLLALTLALGTLMIATSALPAAAADSTRRIALGISMHPDSSLKALDAFSASVGGRKPRIWAVWSEWGGITSGPFPAQMAAGLKARRVVPMINWLPVDPRDLSSTRFRYERILAGDFDAYIREWAQAARDHGGTILLRLMPEMNGLWFPWGIGRFDNTAEDFRRVWRHVHDIFLGPDGVGATNVRFLWSPNKPCSVCNPYPEIYPGNAYVHYVGFSSFNWGAIKTWTPMVDGYRGAMRAMAEVTRKKVIVTETASHWQGGDKGAWIRQGYRQVYKMYPRVVGMVYLNVDMRGTSNHPDWRLQTPQTALESYALIASRPRFKGRIH